MTSTASVRNVILSALAIVCLAVLARPALADPPSEFDQLLNQVRFTPDHGAREKAAKALADMGDPRSLPTLHQVAVYDSSSNVRKEARKSVLKLAGGVAPRQGVILPDGPVGTLMGQLLDGTKDGDREKAAKQLGLVGDPRSIPALEIAAVFDRKDDVRDAARKSAVAIHRAQLPPAEAAADSPPGPAMSGPPAPPAPPAPPTPQYQQPPATGPSTSGRPPSYGPPPIFTQPPAYAQQPPSYAQQPPSYAQPPAYAQPDAPPPMPQYGYAAPPPVVYYYNPAPYRYYYPGPVYYGRPWPSISIGLGFGFHFGGHHR